MFKNMKIGSKIGLGFGLVLVLLSVTSIIGGLGLVNNSSYFSEYERLTEDTNLVASVRANLLMLQINVKDFLTTGSQDNMDAYSRYWGALSAVVAETQKRAADTERAADVKKMVEELNKYNGGFNQVVTIQRANTENADKLFAKGEKLSSIISEIMDSAYGDNVIMAAYLSGNALVNVEKTRLSMQRYLYSNDDKEFEKIEGYIVSIEGILDGLDLRLRSAKRRGLNNQAFDIIDGYSAGFNQVYKTRKERNAIVAELEAIGPQVA